MFKVGHCYKARYDDGNHSWWNGRVIKIIKINEEDATFITIEDGKIITIDISIHTHIFFDEV